MRILTDSSFVCLLLFPIAARAFSSFLVPGGTMKRDVFKSMFAEAALDLRLMLEADRKSGHYFIYKYRSINGAAIRSRRNRCKSWVGRLVSLAS